MEISAYDVALYRSPCCYVIEYDGKLPCEALEQGLARTLQEYPQLAGTLQQQPGKHAFVIDTPSPSGADCLDYNFSYRQCTTRPNLTTMLDLWRSGAMPPLKNQLSGARVTYFEDCDRSLLVFTWDHALMDVDSFLTIATRWLSLTATCCSDTLTSQTAPGLVVKAAAKADALLHCRRPSYQLQADSRATAQQRWPPNHLVAHQLVSDNAGTAAGGAPSTPGSSDAAAAAAAREWLEAHQPPFWDPLNSVERCKAAWKMLVVDVAARFVVGFVPRGVLEAWKEQATVSRLLPPGQYYSSNIAYAALMASTLYASDQDAYDKKGGLTVHFVVNCRGGRGGMAIPLGSVGNGSIWSARVWVSQHLLASAQGTASPDLMYHLKTELHKELTNPHGELNQQFAYWEALRGAGLSGKAHLLAHVKQLKGDITIDYLPDVAAQLPSIPGTKLRYALFRWCLISIPRLFLAGPTLPQDGCCNSAAAKSGTLCSSGSGGTGSKHCHHGSISSSSSSSASSQSCTCGSCGVRFEVTLPRGVAARAAALWHKQGVRELTDAAADADLVGAGGAARTVLEMLLLPRFLHKATVDLLVPLPQLLLHLLGCCLLFLLKCLCPCKCKE